jgi:heat shock protein HtpX
MLLEEQIRKNDTKTIILFIIFIFLISLLGLAIGYNAGSEIYGLAIAALISIFYCTICISQGKNMVISMANGKKVSIEDNPYLYNTVEALSISAGVPMPEIYIIDTDIPNAFATGYKQANSAIAVTSGLLNMMNREELEGVIAHEMSHVRNHDIRSATIAIALSGIIILLGRALFRSGFYGGGRRRSRRNSDDEGIGAVILIVSILVAVLSPVITALIQSAISRQREYQADATAAMITGYPLGLASALEKISKYEVSRDRINELGGKELMGLYISNPFAEADTWFATHPPTEDRIKRLRSM